MKNKILLLDLCGTLINKNTTFDFIDFILSEENNIKYNLFLFFKKNIVIRVFNKIIFNTLKVDLLRVLVVIFLRGYKSEFLNVKAEQYIQYRKINLNSMLIVMVEEYIKSGYRVGIVSASLDVIVKSYCDYFKYDFFFSTELKFFNDVSKGKIVNDLLDNKKEIINKLKINAKHIVFISDNLGDLEAMLLCDDCFAVSNNNKSDLFWNNKGVKILK